MCVCMILQFQILKLFFDDFTQKCHLKGTSKTQKTIDIFMIFWTNFTFMKEFRTLPFDKISKTVQFIF